MVMEHIPGSSLDWIIRARRILEFNSLLMLFVDLADALAHAHRAGVMHRDLKPSNILVLETDELLKAFLIDFGIARVQTATIYNGTAMVGTPGYMSPDQALGLSFDQRSDIYSFGCVLFEAFTGQQVFSAPGPMEMISLHANQKPPSLLERLPETSRSRAIDQVVQTCLQKDPMNRFENAIQLKESLQTILALSVRQDDSTRPNQLEEQPGSEHILDLTKLTEKEQKKLSYPKIIVVGVATCIVFAALTFGSWFQVSLESDKRPADRVVTRTASVNTEIELFSARQAQQVANRCISVALNQAEQKKLESAESTLSAGIRNEAVSQSTKALAKLHYHLGKVLLQREQPNRAYAEFARSQDLTEKSPGGLRQSSFICVGEMAICKLAIAKKLESERQFEQAEHCLHEALKLGEALKASNLSNREVLAGAQYELSLFYHRRRRFAESKSLFDACITTVSSKRDAYCDENLARLFWQMAGFCADSGDMKTANIYLKGMVEAAQSRGEYDENWARTNVRAFSKKYKT
ncbi:MAG: protein kinase [Candidatus Obscuribacterales bacterium]|nr:protein kinase [Candidatus Obscuribacterales bacterium]